MKVIKNNFDKFPIQVTCIHCGSVLEVESIQDIWDTIEPKVICPCCGRRTPIPNLFSNS